MNEVKNIWIEKFLDELKFQHKSKNTINTYKKNLYYLLNFLQTDNILNVTKQQIKSYLATCEADNTFNQRLTSYNVFFNWLRDEEKQISDNPARTIKHVRVRTKDPKYLKKNEIDTFVESIDGKYATRDIAMARVMLNGLRRTEVQNANIKDIEEVNGNYILVVPMGKGEKPRRVVLYPETFEAIQNYLKEDYRQYSKNEALFITQDGKRLSGSAIYKQTKKYLSKFGKEDLSPHKLRHTFATELYNRTGDIRATQEQLGHISANTTMIYTHFDDESRIDKVLKNK